MARGNVGLCPINLHPWKNPHIKFYLTPERTPHFTFWEILTVPSS